MKDKCPKCGAPKEADSCPRCGLVFAKFNPAVLDEGVPEYIRKLWYQVEEGWDNNSRHAIFVEQALAKGAGAFATRCYKSHPDDPKAKEQIEHITDRLEQMLMLTATEKNAYQKNGKKLLLALFIVMVCATIALLYVLLKSPMR
jgi:hypothetical protein